MRRAALPAIALLGFLRSAAADSWAVRLESGAEADSNVSRVEDPARTAAAAGRLGARLDHSAQVLGGTYMADASGLARLLSSSAPSDENVMLAAGELRWLRPFGSSLAAGFHLTVADSFGVPSGTGARTFRNLGGDAMVLLGHGDHHLTLGVGARDFWYKPDHAFSWRGPVANARLDAVLWQPPERTSSIELAATLGFEARSYMSTALAACSPDQQIDECTFDTPLRRRDRYQRAGAALTWTGGLVATGSYQVTVIDSNSFGQSLFRQRIAAAVTAELFGALFITATATLQLDQFPDTILIDNLQHQELTSLDDENRSSLQVLLTRKLSPAWSLEARGAIWRDLGNGAASFRRELAYAGVLYSR
jgi:hypothetical protein